MGNGGGAGGSILILTSSLAGNGIMSVNGGNGSSNGGGGGAGGRLVINYLGSVMSDSYQLKSANWKGNFSITQGLNGNQTLDSVSMI